MTKSELRKIYLKTRNSLSTDEMAEKGRRIADRFFADFDLCKVRILHCFIPIAKFREIDTSPIYKKVWTDFPSIRTITSRVDRERIEIESVAFAAETEFVENAWGISEPANGESLDAVDLDIVLVPLLCFDQRGMRVGYGKGFYDKLLANCRPDCVKIGLSYFPPVKWIDDVADHDVGLNRCVTPEKTFSFR